jgi:hypothetical protein
MFVLWKIWEGVIPYSYMTAGHVALFSVTKELNETK